MVASECSACGQKLAELERGGRLAGLITIAWAAILITAALSLEALIQLPIWLLVLVWVPLTMGSVLFVLRLAKIASVWRQYEARINPGEGQ